LIVLHKFANPQDEAIARAKAKGLPLESLFKRVTIFDVVQNLYRRALQATAEATPKIPPIL
jgi:hypothetical protein